MSARGSGDPTVHGLDPLGMPMRRLGAVGAEAGMPVMLAVRVEDGGNVTRPMVPRGPAAPVRALVRADPRTRLLVTHADRGFIEEVHFGSTPEEQARIWWDICWIWGPPEDHLAPGQHHWCGPFSLGSGMPLRIPETPIARLDLLDLTPADRAAIDRGNAEALGREAGVTRRLLHLVPHTHWDREWYLPEAALRVRLVGMLDDLIARLQRDATSPTSTSTARPCSSRTTCARGRPGTGIAALVKAVGSRWGPGTCSPTNRSSRASR